jgi:hypothetical protein
MKEQNDRAETDLPKISAPAKRALAAAGVKQLRDLTRFSETEIKKWHGIGPNALGKLRQAMQEKRLSFR